MRLSNSMIAKNFMRNFWENSEKIDKINNHLAKKKKIIRPSDDPLGTLKSMQLQSIVNENEQYIKNIKKGKDWIDICDITLDSLKSSLDRVRELAQAGANAPQSELDTICEEVEEIAEYFVQLSNTTIGDRYIFAGHKTKTKPYQNYSGVPGYQGDGNYLSIEIGHSVEIDFSLPGNMIFEDTFDAVRDVIQDLQNGDRDRLGGATLGKVDLAIETAISSRTTLGAKCKRLELAESRIDDANTKHEKLYSEIMDVDVAETIMDLRVAENVYAASLAAGARLMQVSLVDFLK